MKQTFSKRHLRTILTLLETGFFVKTIFGGKKAGAVSGMQFHTVFTRIFEFSKCTREIAKQVG